MKITSKNFLVIILLCAAAALPLRAQTNDPSESKTTNAAVTNLNIQDSDHAPVRIDETGIHVGGADPVDINMPNFSQGRPFSPLIEIVSILAVFGMPVAIVGIFFYFRHRKARMLHETLRAMVEKRVAIPPELLMGNLPNGNPKVQTSRTVRHEKDFRNGLILVAIGGGITALGSVIAAVESEEYSLRNFRDCLEQLDKTPPQQLCLVSVSVRVAIPFVTITASVTVDQASGFNSPRARVHGENGFEASFEIEFVG